MTTKKQPTKETLDFDLKQFKAQKDQLKRVAASEIAQKLSDIKTTLKEIKELVELSGFVINVKQELYDSIEDVDTLHPDWNTSSYDC